MGFNSAFKKLRSRSVQTIHITEGDGMCREKTENRENAYIINKFELQH